MMKMYVGAAKSEPAWRTPRRLPASKTTITPIPIGTTSGLSEGIAEVIAARPAATPPSSGRREVVRLDG